MKDVPVFKIITLTVVIISLLASPLMFQANKLKEENHKWQCEILALELELNRVAWEESPKMVGWNLKSPEADNYFKSYNLFNITCTDVH